MGKMNLGIRNPSLAGLVLVMGGMAHAEEPGTPFRVTTRKAEDRLSIKRQGDRVVFTVLSASGIGGAAITRQDERWPGVVVLRMRLKGMERLQVGNGKVTLSASVSSSGEHRTILGLSEGDRKEVPVERRSPYWTEVRILDTQDRPSRDIPLKDGVFEVTLPRALFASDPRTITLDWIDFFR
jgi:hypothetical protein